MSGKQLVAAASAVQQFEKLLSLFSGDNERARWSALRDRITIYTSQTVKGDKAGSDLCSAKATVLNDGSPDTFDLAGSRVATLQATSGPQKEVFALGDILRAVTVTANGKASDFAARQGVRLELFIHRAVWLTGM